MSLYCSTVMERLEMRWKGGQDQFYTLQALYAKVISVRFVLRLNHMVGGELRFGFVMGKTS